MRVAVVSDIHSNLHALEAVLAELDRDPPDELWCLGDIVGYGPRPNECCALVKERAEICLAGNHDLAVCGDLDLLDFGGDAGIALAWTRGVLDAEADAFLAGLGPAGMRAGVALYHGSARDPVWEYVLSDDVARATIGRAATRRRRARGLPPARPRRASGKLPAGGVRRGADAGGDRGGRPPAWAR